MDLYNRSSLISFEKSSRASNSFLPSFGVKKQQTFNESLCSNLTLDYSSYAKHLNDDNDQIDVQEMLSSFMTCLTTPHQDLLTVLDKYMEICREVVSGLESQAKSVYPVPNRFVKVNQMLSLLTMELNSWMLVQALFKERLFNEKLSEDMEVHEFSLKDSEKEAADRLFGSNSVLRQAQLIVDWLEHQSRSHMANEYQNIELFSEQQGTCGENTLHYLLQKEGKTFMKNNLVTELDPDATLRQKKNLNNLDENDEKNLLFYIFNCIKSGMLEEACKVCQKVGQPWRAATLQGWKLFHDPNVKCLGPGGSIQKVEGNQLRDLWKLACWEMAENINASVIEKAVYASLSCHLKHILPACKTWQDYLWAHMKVFVDQKVECNIRSSLSKIRPMEHIPNEFDSNMLNFEKIFCEIESCADEEIRKQSQSRFNVMQKLVILGDFDVLAEFMSAWCEERTLKPHPILLRFMTHLLLFFKSYGVNFSIQHEASVISAYVDWLIEGEQIELIACYVSYLPSSLQVPTYAKFLEGITGTDNRRHCLELAENSGLDLKAVAICVVENMCKFDELFDINASSLHQTVTENDTKKVDAIEWLLLDDSWRYEAIFYSSVLFRIFICFNKIPACNLLVKKLPKNSLSSIIKNYTSERKARSIPASVNNTIREFMCVTAYLEAVESFSQWFELSNKGCPVKPSSFGHSVNFADKVTWEHNMKMYDANVRDWENSLSSCADNSVSKIKEVLEFADGGWMVDQEETENEGTRKQEMDLLRQKCLPSLFALLHRILQTMKRYKECLQLHDFLMSEQCQLYKVFSEEELQRFSDELSTSTVDSLDLQLDPLGYPFC